MNKSVTKKIFFLVSVISIFFLFIFLNKNKKTESTTEIQPQEPSFVDYYNKELPVDQKIKQVDFNFPKTLPIYQIQTKNLSKNEFIALSKKIGFNSEPQEFNDITDGVKYYINSETHFLIYTPKKGVIKYGMFNYESITSTFAKKLSNDEIIQTATNFITVNGIYPNEEIKPLGIKYLKPSERTEGFEETDINNAKLFQIDFTLNQIEGKIVNRISPESSIFIQLLPSGEIYNSEFLIIKSIESGFLEYPVKNYNEVSQSIKNSKLILFSGDYISPTDIKYENIQKIEAQKIEIAYLHDTKTSELQPIFIISGTANVENTNINNATLYMSSFKENPQP